jgi:metal-dependent amidase/aminoacylase/carboxypeptidase family protein
MRIETFVRGRTIEAILDVEKKVDRCFRAGAMALAATVEIETISGYMPMTSDATMSDYYRTNARELFGAEHYRDLGHRTGSTDMGDLSLVMPTVHPYIGGATGSGHGANYQKVDPELAYIGQAKALADMAIDMLADGAAGAREVLSKSKPAMSRTSYLEFQRRIARREIYEGGQ